MENNILAEFEKFLLSRGFAPPKNDPFYEKPLDSLYATKPL
jgi:hypothetical protein